jgi:CheY-like chemotaxis protein
MIEGMRHHKGLVDMAKKKVLVIEDNALNLKLVRSLLMLEDYQVVEADNAETGIELAKEQQPDLILMDIQLPGMDGLSATRELKTDPEVKGIPVIALTAYAMLGDEQKALEAGCVGYISKPLDTKEFPGIISRFLA